MTSEVDKEGARIVGMAYRSDMLAEIKAVLLARDAAIAECRVAVAEVRASREIIGDDGCPFQDSRYHQEKDAPDYLPFRAATDAAGLLEKYK